MKKKIIALVTIAAAATVLGACSSNGTSSVTSSAAEANPWEEFDTLEEAQEAVGFEITVPDMSEYGEDEVYRVCAALSEIEIQYYDGDDQTAYIRKANDDGDISGDYSEYEYPNGNMTINDVEVTVKGTDADTLNLAIWYVGDYAYCVGFTDPVSFDTMSDIVAGIE